MSLITRFTLFASTCLIAVGAAHAQEPALKHTLSTTYGYSETSGGGADSYIDTLTLSYSYKYNDQDFYFGFISGNQMDFDTRALSSESDGFSIGIGMTRTLKPGTIFSLAGFYGRNQIDTPGLSLLTSDSEAVANNAGLNFGLIQVIPLSDRLALLVSGNLTPAYSLSDRKNGRKDDEDFKVRSSLGLSAIYVASDKLSFNVGGKGSLSSDDISLSGENYLLNLSIGLKYAISETWKISPKYKREYAKGHQGDSFSIQLAKYF